MWSGNPKDRACHVNVVNQSRTKKSIYIYHLEATLTIKRTLPLYSLKLTSFPRMSCAHQSINNQDTERVVDLRKGERIENLDREVVDGGGRIRSSHERGGVRMEKKIRERRRDK